MREGRTTAPENLTEAELIALMDKHGIGTDATHAEHISKIIERGWPYSTLILFISNEQIFGVSISIRYIFRTGIFYIENVL